jgi:hypothetical protein
MNALRLGLEFAGCLRCCFFFYTLGIHGVLQYSTSAICEFHDCNVSLESGHNLILHLHEEHSK